MNEPLDPPDYFKKPSSRDAEVEKLKEDVRELRGLLILCRPHLRFAVSAMRSFDLKSGMIGELVSLQHRIDAELNG